MGFTRQQLEAYRDAQVPDLIGPGLKLLFVGINPGLWTAATQTHFAHPGNRFYPALRLAGIIEREVDRSEGFTDEDRDHLIRRGIGITNLVNRATVRAGELSASELRAGAEKLSRLVERLAPVVVAVAGVTAYRTAFGRPRAKLGRQNESLGGCPIWVVPNPSGLNAPETTESLAEWYAGPARESGVIE